MKIQFIRQSSLLDCIQTLPVQELIDLFNEEGFKVDKNNLSQSVKVANGKLMRQKAQIDIEEKDNIQEETGDFDSVIVAVEKYQGYGFNEKEMTVRKFANIFKQYKNGKGQDNKK